MCCCVPSLSAHEAQLIFWPFLSITTWRDATAYTGRKNRPSKYNMGWPKPGESWETSSKLSFTMAKVAQLLWNKKTFMTAPVVIQSISLSLLNITGSHPYVSSWKHRTLERGTLGWIQRNRLLTGLFWKLESEFPLIIIVNVYLIVTSHTLNSHEIKSSDYFYKIFGSKTENRAAQHNLKFIYFIIAAHKSRIAVRTCTEYQEVNLSYML